MTQKQGDASTAVAIYRLIEDPDQENKCSYQLTHNGHRVGEVRFENREVKVGNETVSTTCQIQLHVTKAEFEMAIAKPNILKRNLETDNWITLNDPRGKAGAIFGHQTISNIESLGKSKYAKRQMAIAELEVIFEKHPMGNVELLFDWCQSNIDLKKLFSNKKRCKPWLLCLIESEISAGKNSTERRQSIIENANFAIGTNNKISKIEDGTLKVVKVNKSTNAPPVLFDDDIARNIAKLIAEMEQMAGEVRNEQQTDGSMTSAIAGPSFAASYEAAKQKASCVSKPEIISLIEVCRRVERRLKKEDPRFKDAVVVIRRKDTKKNKCLDLNDDDDESMIDSDDDDSKRDVHESVIEPKKQPKRKASTKKEAYTDGDDDHDDDHDDDDVSFQLVATTTCEVYPDCKPAAATSKPNAGTGRTAKATAKKPKFNPSHTLRSTGQNERHSTSSSKQRAVVYQKTIDGRKKKGGSVRGRVVADSRLDEDNSSSNGLEPWNCRVCTRFNENGGEMYRGRVVCSSCNHRK